MVSGSSRWLPRTAIERIVRGTGAGAGAAASGAGGAVVWAAAGAAQPASTVLTRSIALARPLILFVEITRSRLLMKWCNGAPAAKPLLLPCPNLPIQSSAEAGPRDQASLNR